MATKKSGVGAGKAKAKKTPAKRTRSGVIAAAIAHAPAPDVESNKYHLVHEEKIPEAAWEAFLDDLMETGNVTRTCKRVGLKRITVYSRAKRDEAFKEAMEEAHAIGMKQLEDHAMQRATLGVRRDVYFQGEIVGGHQEYSDSLIMFMLQARDPRYKRKQEITGADGGPLHLLMQLSDEDLEAEIAARMKELESTPSA